MTTQVVILAAGMGSRLGRSLPKPLTELNDGRTIMQQQFDNIHAAFGKDVTVTIVVGYKLEHIIEAFPDAEFVYNEQYDQTNTSKSLMRALQASGPGGVLWMNGDVVFDPAVLVRAAAIVARDQTFVTVNTSSVADEEVKYTTGRRGLHPRAVQDRQGRPRRSGRNQLRLEHRQGGAAAPAAARRRPGLLRARHRAGHRSGPHARRAGRHLRPVRRRGGLRRRTSSARISSYSRLFV